MPAPGFVWYELSTSDIDASIRFYGSLLGWESREIPGRLRYVVVTAAGKPVGGIMHRPGPASWLGYVGVSGVDAALSRSLSIDASIRRGPLDLPSVGRLATIDDPQGAQIAMIGGSNIRSSAAFHPTAAGHVNWHELHTTDPEGARAFYSGQFGWTTAGDLLKADGVSIGRIEPEHRPERSAWLIHFGVPSIGKAAGAIGQGGGTVLAAPLARDNLPALHARDPQGAEFGLVGPAGPGLSRSLPRGAARRAPRVKRRLLV